MGFSLFFSLSRILFLDKKIAPGTTTGLFSASVFCPLPSLPFCHLGHPFFLFAFLVHVPLPTAVPIDPWFGSPPLPGTLHLSISSLTPQKAACCSERARTASCPFPALDAEHVLSQLSSCAARAIQPPTSPRGRWLFCQHRGKTQGSSRRGQPAPGRSPVPYPWQYGCS